MRRYQPRDRIHTAPDEHGGLTLLDSHSGRLFQLNTSGRLLWAALTDSGGDLAYATQAITTRYPAYKDEIESDVRRVALTV